MRDQKAASWLDEHSSLGKNHARSSCRALGAWTPTSWVLKHDFAGFRARRSEPFVLPLCLTALLPTANGREKS